MPADVLTAHSVMHTLFCCRCICCSVPCVLLGAHMTWISAKRYLLLHCIGCSNPKPALTVYYCFSSCKRLNCTPCLESLQVNFKPNAKRVELSTALDTYGDNYNSRADQSKHLSDLVLKSQLVDLPTAFAIGCVRGNHLILSPLDEAVQMRPHLRHLDTTKKQVKEEDETGEEEKKPSFVTVSVCWNT